jgi:hypothetical protein
MPRFRAGRTVCRTNRIFRRCEKRQHAGCRSSGWSYHKWRDHDGLRDLTKAAYGIVGVNTEATFQAVHVLQVDRAKPNFAHPSPFTFSPEAQMRRFAFLIAVPALLLAGCNTAGPLDPSSAAQSGISAEVRTDSTASTGPAVTSAEAARGGIMIGSGT